MSTLLRLSTPRLEKAVARSVKVRPHDRSGEKEFTVRELREALERRGMSDRDIHSLFHTIIAVLEPPSCVMQHCKHFGGSGSPMNCALERVPGRCSILKQFKQRKAEKAKNDALTTFIEVPEVTLPGGLVVPAFRVSKYLAGHGDGDLPVFGADVAPWVRINFAESRAAAERSGLAVITESQWLAIAYDISQQAINWTGGRVGEGNLYQGLHKGTVSGAQAGNYESADPEERTWHELSNGERIFHFAGNAFSWVVDDIQGNEQGLVSKPFAKDSPSLTTAPYPAMEKGMGWRPDPGANWSGRALVRGGCWCSESYAGAFLLGGGWPGGRRVSVGFRCTLPTVSDPRSPVAA